MKKPTQMLHLRQLPLNDRSYFKWSKLDSEPSRHQIAFSPDLGSATESDLNTDRSEPELRQTSALSSVTEDEPKPTEQWQNNPEYNQVKISQKFSSESVRDIGSGLVRGSLGKIRVETLYR